jgi:hypothetical protein
MVKLVNSEMNAGDVLKGLIFCFLVRQNRIFRLIIATQSFVDVGQAQANGRESPQFPHVGNGESLLH